ncbi:MAG: response regulator transcription factor [Proteobacteria bacterium]|nr:response regulator transcription factor [Pseudomonadota bacterium]
MSKIDFEESIKKAVELFTLHIVEAVKNATLQELTLFQDKDELQKSGSKPELESDSKPKPTVKIAARSIRTQKSASGVRSKEYEWLPHNQLSKREFQIFCKIVEGMRISEISEELNLNPKTISTYRIRIFDKMQLKNDAQLVLYAVDKGIV